MVISYKMIPSSVLLKILLSAWSLWIFLVGLFVAIIASTKEGINCLGYASHTLRTCTCVDGRPRSCKCVYVRSVSVALGCPSVNELRHAENVADNYLLPIILTVRRKQACYCDITLHCTKEHVFEYLSCRGYFILAPAEESMAPALCTELNVNLLYNIVYKVYSVPVQQTETFSQRFPYNFQFHCRYLWSLIVITLLHTNVISAPLLLLLLYFHF